MAITSEEIGITSEVIAINGEGILSEKGQKQPFLRGKSTPVFSCFSSKKSKREFMPFSSEEIGITSERMGITSEEIDIIGEEIPQTSEETPLNGEEMGINGETIPGMKNAERDARHEV